MKMQQFQSILKLEAKGQLYEILLAIGRQTLDYYNPCDWRVCRGSAFMGDRDV